MSWAVSAWDPAPGNRTSNARKRASPHSLWDADPRDAASADLHVFPKAETVGHLAHLRLRRLVGPSGASMPHAVDDHVIELHAVRAFEIGRGLLGLLKPVHAHRHAREILISANLDDIVALGN